MSVTISQGEKEHKEVGGLEKTLHMQTTENINIATLKVLGGEGGMMRVVVVVVRNARGN